VSLSNDSETGTIVLEREREREMSMKGKDVKEREGHTNSFIGQTPIPVCDNESNANVVQIR
jgi:hypothetical protein